MIEYIEKYWKITLVILVGILLLLPTIINSLYLFNAWHYIFEEPSKWSAFWATYLSSIASFAMVFMTWKTIKQSKEQTESNKIDNEKANKENRQANKEENEKNRQLQLRVLKHQQETQWLNDFRKAGLDYIQIYSTNDLINVANMMLRNPLDVSNLLKKLFDREILNETQFAYFYKKDDRIDKLNEALKIHYNKYDIVLRDIQEITHLAISGISYMDVWTRCHMLRVSDEMKKIISNSSVNTQGGIQPFHEAIISRINDIRNSLPEVKKLILEYMQEEKVEIDKLLDD